MKRANQTDLYYEAMRTRDARFDGKFFVGVKTTGIYCRSICPAKPLRKNVEFFSNTLAAERAGYRPCLRCRPESAPASPAWMGRTATVQRAIKIIHRQETLEFNEDQFAERLGVSARHLRRLFVQEVGKTPKQLAFEHRLGLAHKLLRETALPITEIAFASGYRSTRRFNEAFKHRFKRTPSASRRQRRNPKSGLILSLAYRPPFHFEALLDSYRAHRIGNLEWFTPGKMHRVIAYGDQIGTIAISDRADQACLKLEIDFPDTSFIYSIVARVRRLFDLDSDPLVIANRLETDPLTKQILKKHAGIRIPSGWDGFEVAVSTILGQLVSVSQARALVADLIEHLGGESALIANGQAIKLFPTPAQISQSNLKFLKTTAARRRSLIEFSQAILQGRISLDPAQEVDPFIQKLRTIRGIGIWTAEYIALKVLHHTDSFPATDLILGRALKLHSQSAFEKMRPWRGYAAALFWREYSNTLSRKPTKRSTL